MGGSSCAAPVRRRLRVAGWGLYAVYAVYAVLLAVLTALPTHRVWGTVAAVGYGIAAVLAAYRPHRPRWLPGAAAVLGATVVPLLLLGTARAQSEVRVVEDAAALLLRTGTPYFPAPDQLSEYNPYLPGMVVFGLPRAFFGEGVDGRAVVVHRRLRRRGAGRAPCDADAGAGWPGGGTGLPGRPTGSVPVLLGLLACPVVGLVCLGLAHAGRARAGRAGMFLGLAAVLKWTAWPTVPVAVALLAANAVHRRRASSPVRTSHRAAPGHATGRGPLCAARW